MGPIKSLNGRNYMLIRQANVIVGKTKCVINRLINRLYPLEKQKELTVERAVNVKPNKP